MTVKHCAYGDSVATLLNPRCVKILSHKYSLIAARHATVAVAAPSTVHNPANYKMLNVLLQVKFKNENILFALVIYNTNCVK
jgi:hypothetical protein